MVHASLSGELAECVSRRAIRRAFTSSPRLNLLSDLTGTLGSNNQVRLNSCIVQQFALSERAGQVRVDIRAAVRNSMPICACV